jgi:hypothetical protein
VRSNVKIQDLDSQIATVVTKDVVNAEKCAHQNQDQNGIWGTQLVKTSADIFAVFLGKIKHARTVWNNASRVMAKSNCMNKVVMKATNKKTADMRDRLIKVMNKLKIMDNYQFLKIVKDVENCVLMEQASTAAIV